MRAFSPFQLWYGRDEPPVEQRLLRAGPLTAMLHGRDLRYVRRGGRELVRRIYVAVRDHNWNTIPGEVANLQVEAGADRFQVSFDVRHQQAPIEFAWHGVITGSLEGVITYRMEGAAGSAFCYNRIGFCVLHPPQESAGRRYRGQTPEGPIEGTLPLRIGPQRIEDGIVRALFPAVEKLAIEGESGMTVRFDFQGDLFEMEDQRNWTDASFKTYCTPLALPWPKDAHAGQAFRQRVTISTDGAQAPAEERNAPAPAAERAGSQPRPVQLSLGDSLGRSLPFLGLGMASHGQELSAREVELLRALRPDHLRVDLRLLEPEQPRRVEQAARAGASLGCSLELALFLSGAWDEELSALEGLLATHPPIARLLVYGPGGGALDARSMLSVRERVRELTDGDPVAGGTNTYFCELNRDRPPVEALDGVAYSINPQVHAFDELSMVETLAAQAETVFSARSFCRDLPVIVSPVTLKPRFNPNATGPEPELPPGQLPAPVDPRQMSLFGAAWTLGSVKYLAESGATSVTYYETTGWRGVIESDRRSPLPDRFLSEPRMVFPLYHILRDLADVKGGEVVSCRSSDPLAVEGLAVRNGVELIILLANITHTRQRAILGPLEGRTARLRHLNTQSAALAMFEPQRFRSTGETAEVERARLVVDLQPYETVRMELVP